MASQATEQTTVDGHSKPALIQHAESRAELRFIASNVDRSAAEIVRNAVPGLFVYFALIVIATVLGGLSFRAIEESADRETRDHLLSLRAKCHVWRDQTVSNASRTIVEGLNLTDAQVAGLDWLYGPSLDPCPTLDAMVSEHGEDFLLQWTFAASAT